MRRFLRHFFTPHFSNNHRAKALHPEVMLCYILLFTVLNLSIKFIHAQYPDVLGFATDIRIEELFNLTNLERKKVGLEPLKLNATLARAAQAKASDMFTNNYWAHTSPKGKTPWEFITSSGYKYKLAGENLAKNFSTSEGVMEGWMNSPTHKDNIIKNGYKDIGFAIVNGVLNGEETTLVVQMFGATDIPQTPENVISFSEPALTENAVSLSIPERTVAQNLGQAGTSAVLQAIDSVVIKPALNIPTVTRDAVFLFIGVLVGVLILDEIVVAKKKVTRVTGHTIAHVAFLVALALALMAIRKGMVSA